MPKKIEGMPKGVRPRGDKFQWDCSFQGKRRTGTADTLKQAIAAREKARKDILSGPSSGKRAWTLGQTVDGAMLDRWSGSASQETVEKNVRSILTFFGPDTPITDIDEDRIAKFRQWLRERGNTNATINRKTSALSVLLRYSYANRHLDRMPSIGRLQEHNTHERYVTPVEEKQIITVFTTWGKQEHALVTVILLDTGLRIGELLSLRLADVDFARSRNGVITIWKQNAKTKRSRTVPLTERAAKALHELITINSAEKPTDRVCPHDQWWFRRAWDRMKEHIGLVDCAPFVPHILRHTFGSRLAQRGVPLQKIGYLMGHTSPTTTMRYAHLSPQSFEGIIDVLEDINLDRNSINV
jgi:integrase